MTPSARIVNGHKVEIWTRRTLADGDNMYNGCIKQICDAIEDAGSGISGLKEAIDYVSGALDDEVSRAISADSALSAAITDETTRAKNAENVLQTNINNEATARNDADQKLQQQIDTLEAATDVIDVFGTYSQFNTEWKTKYFPTGKKPTITDNDIIKIINDEHTPVGDTGNLTTGHQTYYQWTWTATTHTTTADGDWNFIGFTEPYYNTAEIDGIISDTKTELSSMVSNNYLSAKGAVITGRNIAITEDANNPKITIATKDNVDFNTVSAATAYGSSAKFDNISATGISSNSAIINTISGHSAHFDDIDISAIDLKNINAENIIAKNISSTSSLSGLDLTISNSAKIAGISSTNVSSTNISGEKVTANYITAINVNSTNVSSTNISALSLTANTASGQSANFDDISGKNISANIISGTNVTGDKLTVNTSAKIVGISATNVSSTNITANSLTGNNAEFTNISSTNITGINLSSTNISAKNISGLDNITAKNISATNNISANSATIVNVNTDVLSASYIHSNISSFFKDVSAKNLTADFGRIPNFSTDEITAESSISTPSLTADNITGTSAVITNINGDSGYFTDLRGATLHGVTSSIVVDELISAISGSESNIYVRKDELECKIGSANSATNHSLAQGSANRANNVSLAQGDSNSAYSNSFAQGKSNSANENSFAQGVSSTAYDDSFAQGYRNSADKKSFAQGDSNTAYFDSLAQGEVNRVSNYSIGQGQSNSATNYSIAQGYHNNASNTAQAFGSNLVIESAMAIGKFNKTSSDAVFVIGNGTADDARNDLMLVDNSAAITLINYPYNDNQVDKIIISTTGVSGMYDHSRGGHVASGEYSSEWSNLCNIDNKYVPLSAKKCDIGSNNVTPDNDLVFMQGLSNYANNNSLAQGTNNSAITNSLAQGHHNSAESYSIAVGMNNTAYLQSQAFGKNAFASAGMAINPNIWVSNNPTCAFANGFAMGKDCLASGNSFAFGIETTATVNSLAFGTLNSATNNSLAFGAGITVDSGQIGLGYFPKNNSNYIFYVGAGKGSGANQRRNVLSLTNGGALTINNNSGNGVFSINGSNIYSTEQNSINYFSMVSGCNVSTQATANQVNINAIQSQNLVLYGADSWYLNMWLPDTIESKHFKILKAAAGDGLSSTYKMSIGVSSGYKIIMKNFNQNYKTITGVTEQSSWSTDSKYTPAERSRNVSIYDDTTESNTNTCYLFDAIPSVDNIDVIIDNNSKTFIMIKNHSDLYTYNHSST